MSEIAPATLEGWYALHQMLAIDWAALEAEPAERRHAAAAALESYLTESAPGRGDSGWSAAYQLVGGGADLMLIHFRDTLDGLGEAELALRRSAAGSMLRLEYDFTSVTEAGLYHATAEAASQAKPHSKEFHALIEAEMAAERASAHVQTRLYPQIPEAMRYVCFYPMSKRRTHPDNWYALPVSDRNRMMREHGLSGRRFAGRVFQVITGSVGFDDWEWGVTLYAADPLEFKRIVTELRYDEASTRYGEFGEFFTGFRLDPQAAGSLLHR